MSRKTLLTLVSLVALAVGACALLAPEVLLASKGVSPAGPVRVWMREVGALLLVFAWLDWAVRAEPDSPAMRAVLLANALVHLGLLPIELVAYARGVIPRLGGVVPNSALHVVLAACFLGYARRVAIPRRSRGGLLLRRPTSGATLRAP